ncbi:hypothetical protein H0H87_012690 [Tephrocybe sp. NHM501043]|nr:hypothetical protein H0H87_012690 [Tephrocybe sp. NHM501043]
MACIRTLRNQNQQHCPYCRSPFRISTRIWVDINNPQADTSESSEILSSETQEPSNDLPVPPPHYDPAQIARSPLINTRLAPHLPGRAPTPHPRPPPHLPPPHSPPPHSQPFEIQHLQDPELILRPDRPYVNHTPRHPVRAPTPHPHAPLHLPLVGSPLTPSQLSVRRSDSRSRFVNPRLHSETGHSVGLDNSDVVNIPLTNSNLSVNSLNNAAALLEKTIEILNTRPSLAIDFQTVQWDHWDQETGRFLDTEHGASLEVPSSISPI